MCGRRVDAARVDEVERVYLARVACVGGLLWVIVNSTSTVALAVLLRLPNRGITIVVHLSVYPSLFAV